MNTISGRVVLKETGIGIPNLAVVIHDVDPGTRPEESVARGAALSSAATASSPGLGDRVGSRITASDGSFEFTYEDAEFRIRNPDERRPDLLLLVLAPEEPGLTEAERILYVSPEVCQNAGRTEQRLIRIPGDALRKAGVPVPLDPAVAREASTSVIGKLNQALTFHADVRTETRRIAAAAVAQVRQEHEATTRRVRDKVVESLIGVSAADARKRRVVMPGERPEALHYEILNQNLAENVNARPIAGYLVLTEAEAEPFRSGTGWRQNVPATEIEPLLYRGGTPADRSTLILRDDPVSALCRAQASPDLHGDDGDDGSTGGGDGSNGSGDPTEITDGVLTLQDLPRFVGRLVDAVIPPEEATLFGTKARPSAEDVQQTVSSLQLRSGPADLPALYDFHQLQLAFDHVWQHAIDDGVLEATNQLSQSLVDSGGDPLLAVSGSTDPVRALKLEARHVQLAQRSLQAAGVVARTANVPLDTPGPGTPQPRPPVIHPPFFDHDLVVGDWRPPPSDPLSLLEDALNERYKFEVFAPGTTNFGLLVTYRQRWEPLAHQVGDLVKTLTLAPKETRRVTSKRVVHRERSVKEMEGNQRHRKDEISDTMRSEAEIVQKAQDKTNFSVTSKGNFDIGIASGDTTTSFTKDAESSSQETKKAFHEAVLKAAQEFRDERKLEVETKEVEDLEATDSAEIVNPNDELTVTYLFYELQRRFRVSERIHRLRPVVLVAMEVPNPSRASVDKVLLSHAWIVNRVLLDDRYRPALDYLCTRIVGDELELGHLAQNVADARNAVATLQTLHRDLQAELRAREAAYNAAVEARAGGASENESEGALEKGWESLFGSGSGEDVEALRIREDLRKEQYERAVREEKELRMRLDSEIASLTNARAEHARAHAQHSNRLLQIAGLRAHFKENVLYYMQAIWSYTFRDQIFFALCDVKVPKLRATQKTYDLSAPDELPLSIPPRPGQVVLEVRADVQLATDLDPAQDFVTLAEVADLDAPLGFKGNYMIFPLKESNALTDYMMVPYVDSELGLRDPDELGSWTPEDFTKYARCLLEQVGPDLTEAERAALVHQLEEQYRRIVSSPRRASDEVVVPTKSLYIEALPGAHPLLEDFKLAHRMIDVKRAQAETRKLELENLRYAARLLDAQFEDPEIERKIEINGSAQNVTVPPDI